MNKESTNKSKLIDQVCSDYGITCADLSRILEKPQSHVSDWKHNKRVMPENTILALEVMLSLRDDVKKRIGFALRKYPAYGVIFRAVETLSECLECLKIIEEGDEIVRITTKIVNSRFSSKEDKEGA